MGKLEVCKEELKKLIQEGRVFIVSLEDCQDTVPPGSVDEYTDVKRFRAALDKAAAVLKAASLAVLLALPARAWEFPDNPDRFPSIGLHVDNEKLDGDRTEIVINNIGERLPYRNSDETEFTWRGGADVRLPLHRSITMSFMYERVETEWFFKRRNTLGGDLYEENRRLSGYNYQLGFRLYLNR